MTAVPPPEWDYSPFQDMGNLEQVADRLFDVSFRLGTLSLHQRQVEILNDALRLVTASMDEARPETRALVRQIVACIE